MPPPARDFKRGPVPKYPFKQCTAVGMSFFVPGKKCSQVTQIVNHWNNKLRERGWRFVTRGVDADGEPIMHDGVKGVRVYRVE